MTDNLQVRLRASYDIDHSYDSERFIKLKVRVCHDGENLNGSHISKEALQDALPSIYNIPLLANVVVDDDGNIDFGGHDRKIVKDAMDESQYRLQYVEAPVGVFPADCADACVLEEGGKHYVYATAYLWRGYANYAEDIILSRQQSDVSMEVIVNASEYDTEDSLLHINKFTFTGVTLLGADRRPAMQGANATVQFSVEDKEKLLTKLLCALEQEGLSKRKDGGTELPKDMETKVEATGESTVFEEKAEVVAPVGTPEVLEAGFENSAPTDESVHESFAASYQRKRAAVQGALKSEIVRDENGDCISETYYYVMDMNDDYVLVERSVWTREGYSCDNGRFAYAYNAAEDTAVITSEFEQMVCRWMTPDEAAKLDASVEVFEELAALRAYKREKEVASIFAKFTDLVGNEQFDALVADNSKFSVDELQRECYVIRGMAHDVEVPETAPRLPINKHNVSVNTAPYGGVFEKFGFKNKNQED